MRTGDTYDLGVPLQVDEFVVSTCVWLIIDIIYVGFVHIKIILYVNQHTYHTFDTVPSMCKNVSTKNNIVLHVFVPCMSFINSLFAVDLLIGGICFKQKWHVFQKPHIGQNTNILKRKNICMICFFVIEICFVHHRFHGLHRYIFCICPYGVCFQHATLQWYNIYIEFHVYIYIYSFNGTCAWCFVHRP